MILRLTEYGAMVPWPQGRPLAELKRESARWKELLGLRETPFEVQRRGSQFWIRARGVTGFIAVGDLKIEIAPKFLAHSANHRWQSALWRILSLLDDELPTDFDVTAGQSDDSLPDLMGRVLLHSLRAGRLQGWPRGYSERRESLPVYRGRLDLARISELVIAPYALPCIFDVYDEDTPLGRLLKWAAHALAETVESSVLARALEDEFNALGEVSNHPPGLIEAENLRLPFQFAYLEPALGVARLLLRCQSLEHREEEEAAPGFLWKSADVFERFVRFLLERVCLRQNWQLTNPVQRLARAQTRATPHLITIPDYLISARGRVIVALDAKYKTGSPKSSDVYQVMAAGRINSCAQVGLIYPAFNRKTPDRAWIIRGAGNPHQLSALFVDLLQMNQADGGDILTRALTQRLVRLANPKQPNL